MRKELSLGLGALVTAGLLSFGAVHAATITVSTYSTGSYNSLTGTGTFVGEDFEGLGTSKGEGQVGGSLQTAVGSFSSIGGTGTGGTVTGGDQPSGNTGTQLALRNGNVFGRENLVPTSGSWFLDSNDTIGMIWNVALAGGRQFSRVIFALSDASDQGAFLRITVGTDVHEVRGSGRGALADGNDRLVVVDFGAFIGAAKIELANYASFGGTTPKSNDGFSIDGLRVEVAPVPLPAGALLLGSALFGLGAAARSRAARA